MFIQIFFFLFALCNAQVSMEPGMWEGVLHWGHVIYVYYNAPIIVLVTANSQERI